ncbi:MAG: hypothetical protein QW701_01975 [Candidatus Nezhaarchaeales archaeon]
MVHASVQHIIGTVALLGLISSIVLAFQMFIGFIVEDTVGTQLSQIAEYTSMSIANIVSLTDFTFGMLSTTEAVSKRLGLPASINGKPYNLTIIEKDEGYYVQVKMVGSNLYAESPISVKLAQKFKVFSGEEELLNVLEASQVEPKYWVYGGSQNVVVWCLKFGDVMYVGLGLSTRRR